MCFIKYYISFIKIISLLLIIYYFFNIDFKKMFVVLIIFLSTYLPKLIERIFKLTPLSIFLGTIILISSIYLGSSLNFYDKFKYFDIYEHSLSGIFLGDLGLSLIKQKKIKTDSIIIFVFCFSMTIAIFWEIFEFGADTMFKSNHQNWKYDVSDTSIGVSKQSPGLIDTMTDIIAYSISNVIFIIFIYNNDKILFKKRT